MSGPPRRPKPVDSTGPTLTLARVATLVAGAACVFAVGIGMLVALAGVATLTDALRMALQRAGSEATGSIAGAEGLRVVSTRLPNPSPVVPVALAFAASWPAAIGVAHLLARVVARR